MTERCRRATRSVCLVEAAKPRCTCSGLHAPPLALALLPGGRLSKPIDALVAQRSITNICCQLHRNELHGAATDATASDSGTCRRAQTRCAGACLVVCLHASTGLGVNLGRNWHESEEASAVVGSLAAFRCALIQVSCIAYKPYARRPGDLRAGMAGMQAG